MRIRLNSLIDSPDVDVDVDVDVAAGASLRARLAGGFDLALLLSAASLVVVPSLAVLFFFSCDDGSEIQPDWLKDEPH